MDLHINGPKDINDSYNSQSEHNQEAQTFNNAALKKAIEKSQYIATFKS